MGEGLAAQRSIFRADADGERGGVEGGEDQRDLPQAEDEWQHREFGDDDSSDWLLCAVPTHSHLSHRVRGDRKIRLVEEDCPVGN